jgi:uncharacterized protein YfcZ (UPF0381/DUF406 family)
MRPSSLKIKANEIKKDTIIHGITSKHKVQDVDNHVEVHIEFRFSVFLTARFIHSAPFSLCKIL